MVRGWWRRIVALRVLLSVAVGGIVVGIIFWGGFNTVLEYTNRLEFCVSCHEMKDTVFVEYKTSVHYQNASGVRAICSDCHVPKEWLPKLIRKVRATNELYHKVVGTIGTPEKFEAHRLELARRVWATMTANGSQECRNCHSFEAMDFHKQRPKSSEVMQKRKEDETCISCHKGIAHKLPDMSQTYKEAFNTLMSAAAQEGAKADTLYSLTTKSLFVERGDAKADSNGDGRLLAASRVKVVGRDGDWLNVRIDGWQQEGAERVFYALQGQRIITAALGPAALAKVERLQTVLDPNTDLTWFEATLTAWVSKDALIADQQKLWAYGAEMYGASCGMCHSLRPPNGVLANQWIGNLNAMKRFITLDDEQYRFLQKYLQFHAKDTVGADG